MFHKLLYEKVKFNIILTSVHQKLSSSGQQRNKIKFSTNKNKKKKKQLKGLKFISDSTIIFFLSDSVFTHPFNTKRLYMYLFL